MGKLTTRAALLAGFGGLLILMAFAGVDAVSILNQIQTRNERIRNDFVHRNRTLEQIRSDLYLSGTFIRDYVLEPDARAAEMHRAGLEQTHRQMDAAIESYEKLLPAQESAAFGVLRQELRDYWHILDPALGWSPEQRRQFGYPFWRNEVYPRRTTMLGIADQIAAFNEQQLNAGNQQVGDLFAQFRLRLGITLAITLGLGFALAAFTMFRILRLENDAALRYAEIAKAREELKELSARLVEVQENERRTISRELHDEVGQSLSALLVELGNLSAALSGNVVQEMRGHVDVIRKLAEGSVEVVRNMALLLRPSMLDDLGLVPALQWQAREVSKRTGMRVDVAADHVSDELPEEHKTCVYRVVQEALNNCSKHAAARLVRVTVEQQPSHLLLTIQDDGQGFEGRSERGLGLLGMEERVTHLGGSFAVDSQAGHGTLLTIDLPLKNHPNGHGL
jgi:signal transduction histidine kinase